MLKAPLNHESIVLGFWLIAWQKMESTLPITIFTDKQCDDIQGTYLPTFLSWMGINQKSTWSIQSRPAIYSGMAIPKFKNTQGAGAGKLLISHLHKDDNVSQIICNSLDALQIHARTSWPVLSQDETQVCRYVCGTNKTTISNGLSAPWPPNSGNSMMPTNTWCAKATNLGSEANKMVTPS
jgi:hypothetical protein